MLADLGESWAERGNGGLAPAEDEDLCVGIQIGQLTTQLQRIFRSVNWVFHLGAEAGSLHMVH